MELITTLEDAIEYVKPLIHLEKLPMLHDFEYGTIIGAGFVEKDGEYDVFNHPDGHTLWIEDARGVGLRTPEATGRIRLSEGGSGYLLVGQIGGLSYNVTLLLSYGGDFTFLSVNLSYDDIKVGSNRDYTAVATSFIDKDGQVLRMDSIFVNGEVHQVEFRKGWRKHCLSGPAVVKGDKIEYYIGGVKMSKKRWLERA